MAYRQPHWNYAHWLLIVLVAACIALPTSQAHAQASQPAQPGAQEDVPLVIVRYNQERVYYDRQLYRAASRALEIKPGATFTVVSFVPQPASQRQQQRMQRLASKQTNQFVSDLVQMGIPRERIQVSREPVRDSRYHEIYLYVD